MSPPQPSPARPRFRSRTRLAQLWLDAALGLALAVPSLVALVVTEPSAQGYRTPDPVNWLLVLVACLAVAWRRRQPLLVLLMVATALAAVDLLDYSPGFVTTYLSLLVAAYTAGTHSQHRSAAGGALVILALYSLLALVVTPRPPSLFEAVAVASILLGTFVFGRSLGLGRAYTAELEQRAEDLARGREVELRGVIQDERARIARELHDVVAHHVSVMTVQASAARRQFDRDPAGSQEAIAAIESTGRTVLAEMRRIVGVLRARDEVVPVPDDTEALAPQPGLADLPALIAKIGDAGLPVMLKVAGEPRPLSAGVDLAVYRIVQESLTNALRHAGPTTAEVVIRYTARELDVQISDRGHGLAAGLDSRDRRRRTLGHGLLGMRERVGVYGGEIYAGPRAGGGFEVLARIPIESVTP